MPGESIKEPLESMIDAHGLDVVLGEMADICYEKSLHVQSTWRDKVLQQAWKKLGDRLTRISEDRNISITKGDIDP